MVCFDEVGRMKIHNMEEINRRQFLAGTGVTMAALATLPSHLVMGADSDTDTKIDIGLVGCGGRGRWITNLFQKHGGYNVVAVADYFQDKADAAGNQFKVPSDKRFTGLSGYKKLLEQKLDAVVIQSPPYFHPEQAAAGVAAGKHVYLAKPIAVDVPGCLSVEESAKLATEKKQVFWIDFQTRAHPAYQEIAKRIHAGEIGDIISAEASYQCSIMFEQMDAEYRKNADQPEARLRAWAIDRVFSGDIITEQNIHSLDVASWMLNAEPIQAYGMGGRKRKFLGDCWDHFAVIFEYPGNVLLSFNSKQDGVMYDDIMCRVYGEKGTADTHYSGKVFLHGQDDAYNGDTPNLYADGAIRNIASFHKSILAKDFSNPTAAPSVRSNLTTILGRTAAYKKQLVTWADMIKAKEKWEANLKGLTA